MNTQATHIKVARPTPDGRGVLYSWRCGNCKKPSDTQVGGMLRDVSYTGICNHCATTNDIFFSSPKECGYDDQESPIAN